MPPKALPSLVYALGLPNNNEAQGLWIIKPLRHGVGLFQRHIFNQRVADVDIIHVEALKLH